MSWTISGHSKKAVMRAGDVLVDPGTDIGMRWEALDILSDWRAAHAYPMHALLIFLRQKAVKIDGAAVVVQRLKRTPSILNKLSRFCEMKLHRMQDIGGCRAVVGNARHVYELTELIKKSNTKHELHRIYDYVENPKSSGYRGVHLVFKYGGAKAAFNGYLVELQLRSKVQHSWATAVEVVDFFTKQALKASQGQDEWLRFFQCAGTEFSKLEHRPIRADMYGIDTASELVSLTKSLNVIHCLNAFAVSTDIVTKNSSSKTDYFLLELASDVQTISITQFRSTELTKATKLYLDREKTANGSHDVVLVAAGSMHALKAAYPNYFADTGEFIRNLHKVLDRQG